MSSRKRKFAPDMKPGSLTSKKRTIQGTRLSKKKSPPLSKASPTKQSPAKSSSKTPTSPSPTPKRNPPTPRHTPPHRAKQGGSKKDKKVDNPSKNKTGDAEIHSEEESSNKEDTDKLEFSDSEED